MPGSGTEANIATQKGSALKRAIDAQSAASKATATPENKRALAQADKNLADARRDFNTAYGNYTRSMKKNPRDIIPEARFIS